MAGGAVVTTKQSGNPFRTGFVKREYLWAFSLVTSLFFLWGFAYGLLDVLNKHFQNVLHITKLQSTGLQVAYFGIGYFAYSPVAAWILKKWGYKKCIISGLALYSLGAILFWPVAHASLSASANKKAIFGGFVVCTAVVACGLATLETAANSYVSTIPPLNVANFRLQFSQSFNGVASFSGPLIASKYFFTGENANNLTNVQYVYLAVALLGVSVAAAFVFTKLPEVSEEELQATAEAMAESTGAATEGDKSFWRTKALFGFATQFCYVGAQVTIGTFFINYCFDAGISDAEASNLLSYGLITFTVCRFIGTAILSVVNAPVLLLFNACGCIVCIVLICTLKGMAGVVCLIVIMGFESVMYPVIFVLGTSGLGRHTRRGAGLLVQGVAGGAVFPPIQGAIAGHFDTKKSFWIALPAFIVVAAFALMEWRKLGWKIALDRTEVELENESSPAAADLYPTAEISGKEKGHGQTEDVDYVETLGNKRY